MTVTSLPALGDTNWYAWAGDVDGIARAVDNRSIPYVPQWTANTAVSAGAVWMDPTGQTIVRNSSGTTRATYDATEQALWTVSSGGGAGGVPTSRAINTTAPLSGGGTLAADLTLSVTASSTTASGVVELATNAETQTGTDTVRAVTPAGLQSKVTSETALGLVELATAAETTTGTDTTRAVHPAGLKVELDKKANSLVTQTTQTGTTYTFVLADGGTLVEGNNASAQTYTVPPNSSVAFPVGTSIVLRQYGTGQITLAAGAGVTLRSRGAALKTAGQYAELTFTKRATDEWVVSGDVTT